MPTFVKNLGYSFIGLTFIVIFFNGAPLLEERAFKNGDIYVVIKTKKDADLFFWWEKVSLIQRMNMRKEDFFSCEISLHKKIEDARVVYCIGKNESFASGDAVKIDHVRSSVINQYKVSMLPLYQ